MPTIPATSTFEFLDRKYYATGRCIFSGPHSEFEGVADLIIRHRRRVVVDPSADLVRAAEDVLETEASEDLMEMLTDGLGSPSYSSYDRDDDYDRNYTSGPDYWTDPESGEWRCG